MNSFDGLPGTFTPDQCGSRDEQTASATAPLTPRLQLRWEFGVSTRNGFLLKGEEAWLCHYELVIPLCEGDIRREIYNDDGDTIGERADIIVALKSPTLRGVNGRAPCIDRDGSVYFDPPFRDGVHALWDAKLLGGLPIYCVAPDGRFVRRPEDKATGALQ